MTREHLFKPGQSGNPAGRPKGAVKLRTRTVKDVLAICEANGFCPFEKLIEIAKKSGKERNVIEACKEILPYVASKFKTIEHHFASDNGNGLSVTLNLGGEQNTLRAATDENSAPSTDEGHT